MTTLRFLATGSHQQIIGDASYVTQSSVSRVIRIVVGSIVKQRTNFICFPEETVWSNLRRNFYEIAHFPGGVAAVDGTHVPIKKPRGIDELKFIAVEKNIIL